LGSVVLVGVKVGGDELSGAFLFCFVLGVFVCFLFCFGVLVGDE